MNYSVLIESIRVERLELVEFLAENRQQLVDTLHYAASISPLVLQNVRGVLETYRQLKIDVHLMINDLDALEEELLQRLH